ncbi:40S ribosomal protein S12-like [Artibeus jamaicensis]|uniref:40S ribosomal protein S12-like n=1 Tax=Artibeus jamaicensis TaxID=9417 RepID=UPI00235A8194|nr:40S ribosomal protein S12-like [Artibeus jamaicensis]
MAEEGITAGGVMDINTALQDVLKTTVIHDGLACGICKASKAFVCLHTTDGPLYVKFVAALCAKHQINLIKDDSNKKLGVWVDLFKISRVGTPHKVVGCSSVIVKD